MNPRNQNYIQRCLEDFGEISKKKYGAPFNHAAIEKAVIHLRSKETLKYADLRYFESAEHWWFKNYWAFPSEEHVSSELSKVSFNFSELPQSEVLTIGELLNVFKSIELVSIILRFASPDNYGIISPPVERVLDVRRGSDAVETYFNYLKNLREICKEYVLDRVADADMALWVLHEKCFGAFRDEKIEKQYLTDFFMLQLRAKNLVGPLRELSDTNLAQALVEVKPDLAGLIACYRFEILIRELAIAHGVLGPKSRLKLEEMIDGIKAPGISQSRKDHWHELRNIRNNLFHHGRQPTLDERDGLLNELRNLEDDVRRSGRSRR